MTKSFSTYTEFRDELDRISHTNWAVTYEYQYDGQCEIECEILQWEPLNAKWYRLKPFEGREEAGLYWDIWNPRPKPDARIINVRPL